MRHKLIIRFLITANEKVTGNTRKKVLDSSKAHQNLMRIPLTQSQCSQQCPDIFLFSYGKYNVSQA